MRASFQVVVVIDGHGDEVALPIGGWWWWLWRWCFSARLGAEFRGYELVCSVEGVRRLVHETI